MQPIPYIAGPRGAGALIGGALAGGTVNSVLFVNPANVLAQDNPNFTYTIGTTTLTAPTITAATAFLAPNGASGAPSFAFSSQSTTGIFRSSGSRIVLSSASTDSFSIGGNQAFLPAAGVLGWASDTNVATGTFDVTIVRDAANILAIKNGANAEALRIYGTTTGPKYLSLSHDATNGVIDTAASSGLLSLAPTNATSVAVGKPFTKIGGITTVGAVGAPAIVATGRVTAQSAANASVSTFTVGAADGSFEVSGNMNVTASTTLVTTLTCTYTDESNVARSMILPVTPLSGTFVAAGAITGAGASVWETPVMHIRCKAATAITILTSVGTFTGVTYTAEGIIKQTA